MIGGLPLAAACPGEWGGALAPSPIPFASPANRARPRRRFVEATPRADAPALARRP
jgi:hypothetical protein